jgi:hypothetical protein
MPWLYNNMSKYNNVKGNIVGDSSSGSGNIMSGGNTYVGGNVINDIGKSYDQDTAQTLARVAKFIKESNDPAAEDADLLFNRFTGELNKPQPDKSKLRSSWSLIEKALPAVNALAGVANKILPLFS